jgi:hypothetical protein
MPLLLRALMQERPNCFVSGRLALFGATTALRSNVSTTKSPLIAGPTLFLRSASSVLGIPVGHSCGLC